MKHILYSFIALCTALGFTACDDENDDWTPGEAESADSPGVFFSADNAYSFEFESGMGDEIIELHLQRLNSTNAVTVPLTSTVDNSNIKVPASVEFAAGQTDATISINCNGVPEREKLKFSISIPDEYKTLYGQGTDSFEGTVAVVAWVTIDPEVKFTYYDSNNKRVYDPSYSEWQLLEGSSKMKLTNFMNSGKDLMFTLDSTQTGCSTTYIGVNPIYNYYYDAAGADYDCWYFYDTENDKMPDAWTMVNGEPIAFCYLYSDGYSYFNLDDSYGCFTAYFSATGDDWTWVYVWFYFNVPDEYVGNIPYTK